jgi:hypothetical protein
MLGRRSALELCVQVPVIGWCALVAGWLALVAPARAVSITFRNGLNVVSSDNVINIPVYTGTEDMARNSAVGTTNLNYGGVIDLELGESNPGDDLTPYVRFDVSALAGQYQTINSITLRLYKYGIPQFDPLPAIDRQVDLFVVDAADGDWVEGNGQGTSVPGAATYDDRQDGNSLPWNGSDTLALASQLLPAGNGYQSFSLDSNLVNLTSLIDSWVVAGQNAGLRLGFTNGSAAPRYVAFAAKDNPTGVEAIPELIIEYTSSIPEPATATLFVLGGAMLVLAHKRRHHSERGVGLSPGGGHG